MTFKFSVTANKQESLVYALFVTKFANFDVA